MYRRAFAITNGIRRTNNENQISLSARYCLGRETGLMFERESRFRRMSTSIPPIKQYTPAISHISQFKAMLGENNVISNDFDMDKYRHDWKRNFFGGSLVCLPSNTEQISKVMAYCNANNIGVVVQGGNTGLVGGAVGTDRGELILSMERLNKVINIDQGTATVICEAGCILEILNNAVSEHGFMIPLDLGPKGSCMIGGNISTNAGGLRVVRYGSLQANVLGLEVVKADGEVLDMLRTLYKDNTGYHLKHLFIGAEGTLGVVTKVALRLAVTPKSSSVVFAKVKQFSAVPSVLQAARELLGANMSAFEFMDSRSIGAIRKVASHLLTRVTPTVLPDEHTTNSDNDNGLPGEVAVLIEATGSDPETDAMKLDKFVSKLVEDGLVEDAVLSADKAQEQALWLLREQVPVALIDMSRQLHPDPSGDDAGHKGYIAGYMYKFDLSLPLVDMPTVLLETMKELKTLGFTIIPDNQDSGAGKGKASSSLHSQCTLDFCNYGHAGDQNLHLNIHLRIPAKIALDIVQKPDVSRDVLLAESQVSWQDQKMSFTDYCHDVHHLVDEALYKAVLKRRGSISAEHGIGQEKKGALLMARSPQELMLMRQVKSGLDPNNILNPGKMF